MSSPATFPDGFLWGAATAAYQIEGAAREDGRGSSIWDVFSATPGKTINGDTGDVACDHYHRVEEDADLMADLGLAAYRFSVAWPRIVPSGSGEVNPRGLDFYSRLVDRLLERRIQPVATLYHWDLPQPLQDAGGWPARDTALRFAEYAEIVGRALGDRVSIFTTLNEPFCSAYLGHATGEHAPGCTDPAAAYAAVHHLNLAHGLGASALRAVVPSDVRVALTLNLAAVRAASSSPADSDAARHVDGIANRIFLEPVFRGRYPSDVLADLADVTDFGFVRDGDLAAISVRPDLLGINYYTPAVVAAKNSSAATGARSYPGTERAVEVPQPGPHTAMGWLIEPAGLTELLLRVHRDLPDVPLLITENGAAFDDVVGPDGVVHDEDRIAYLHGHLGAVRQAIAQGADVRGYFVWTVMDNFEWAKGFTKRFGLVRVDYDNQRRTIKDSGRWYRGVIAANALPD
jgi:beta-glucosidase